MKRLRRMTALLAWAIVDYPTAGAAGWPSAMPGAPLLDRSSRAGTDAANACDGIRRHRSGTAGCPQVAGQRIDIERPADTLVGIAQQRETIATRGEEAVDGD